MLTLVPTPIGNIGDMSLRAIEALSEADTLLCEDTRVTKKLIHILKERYQTTFKENQTFISLHSHNEQAFVEKLEPSFFEQNIVYASDAGMPGVSDPGQALVSYCIKNDVKYDVLPGANAVLTAFVASGFIETQMLFFGFLLDLYENISIEQLSNHISQDTRQNNSRNEPQDGLESILIFVCVGRRGDLNKIES